jgi:hypothetical protein
MCACGGGGGYNGESAAMDIRASIKENLNTFQ